MSDNVLLRNVLRAGGRLAWVLAAAVTAFSSGPATAAAPDTVRAVVLDTEMVSHDKDGLVFRGSVEVSGPERRSYEVYFQARLHGGAVLKLADNKSLVLQSKDLVMPKDQPTARWTDCRVEMSVADLEAAVNLPRGQESILWVDCSVFDVTAGKYITNDFTVSTPLLVGTDQGGKVVKIDGDGVWARMAQNNDPQMRDLLVGAAEVSAARSKAALPALLAVLKDADEVKRRGGMLGIQRLQTKFHPDDKAVAAAYRAALADKDAWVRFYAADGLWDAEKAEEVVPTAVALLREPQVEVDSHAGDLLVKVGRPAVPALRKALDDGDEEFRVNAAEVLLRDGAESKAAVRVLIEALKKAEAAAGGEGSKTVAMLENRFDAVGPKSADAVPVLIDGLKNGEKRLQTTMVRALGQVGPDAGAAVETLTGLLKDEDVNFRRDVIVALGRIGPGARAAVPALSDIMKGQDDGVRIDAAFAVWSINKADAALSVLLEAVRDRDEGTRRRALQALANVGGDGKGAFEAVARALHEDPSRDVRLDAIFALKNFGGRAVPELIRALKDGAKADRNMVIIALGEMGDKAKDAVPAIVESLKDENEFVRGAAAAALKKLDPEAARKAGIEE